jgi:hypothetical protein
MSSPTITKTRQRWLSGPKSELTKRSVFTYVSSQSPIHHLSDIEGVQVVMGGDHGDIAFQFGASVSVQLKDDKIIHFELVCCELICCKDTSRLINKTILDALTAGLKIVATWYLNVERNGEGQLLCEFKKHNAQQTHVK